MNNYNNMFHSLLEDLSRKIVPRKDSHHHVAIFLAKKKGKDRYW